MINQTDERSPAEGDDGARLLGPWQAVGAFFGSLVAAFGLLLLSFSTDLVQLSSRVPVLLLPVALGSAPLAIVAAFVRRRAWKNGRTLRAALGVYVVIMLLLGCVLLSRNFGVLGMPPGPPVPASASASPSATPT